MLKFERAPPQVDLGGAIDKNRHAKRQKQWEDSYNGH
jgi:hypothetical protein